MAANQEYGAGDQRRSRHDHKINNKNIEEEILFLPKIKLKYAIFQNRHILD